MPDRHAMDAASSNVLRRIGRRASSSTERG
jgi:hypothetical protein